MNDADIYEPKVSRRESRHDIRGVDYLVHEWGDAGLPLLFYLHGWGDTGSTLQFLVDSLRGEWRVVAPDLRGFGGSRGNATSYWFPDYLADVDRLLDLYSQEPVALLGHSMGGNIAGLYAGARPERVQSFVNIEGFGLKDADPAEAPAHYRQWLGELRDPAAFATYPDFRVLADKVASRNPGMSRARAEFVARCWGRRHEDEVRLRADPLHKLPNPVLYRRAESEACWRNIVADVLLVVGADSGIRDRLGDWPGTADGLPSARSFEKAIIPDAGHMLHFEAPGLLAAAIEKFLN